MYTDLKRCVSCCQDGAADIQLDDLVATALNLRVRLRAAVGCCCCCCGCAARLLVLLCCCKLLLKGLVLLLQLLYQILCNMASCDNMKAGRQRGEQCRLRRERGPEAAVCVCWLNRARVCAVCDLSATPACIQASVIQPTTTSRPWPGRNSRWGVSSQRANCVSLTSWSVDSCCRRRLISLSLADIMHSSCTTRNACSSIFLRQGAGDSPRQRSPQRRTVGDRERVVPLHCCCCYQVVGWMFGWGPKLPINTPVARRPCKDPVVLSSCPPTPSIKGQARGATCILHQQQHTRPEAQAVHIPTLQIVAPFFWSAAADQVWPSRPSL